MRRVSTPRPVSLRARGHHAQGVLAELALRLAAGDQAPGLAPLGLAARHGLLLLAGGPAGLALLAGGRVALVQIGQVGLVGGAVRLLAAVLLCAATHWAHPHSLPRVLATEGCWKRGTRRWITTLEVTPLPGRPSRAA